jgi:pimeloyl-ACP methyl ester carboxylesterase
VCGVDDQVTTAAEMKRMADTIAGARYVPIADAGHLSHVEAPGAFLNAVTSFLDSAAETRGEYE